MYRIVLAIVTFASLSIFGCSDSTQQDSPANGKSVASSKPTEAPKKTDASAENKQPAAANTTKTATAKPKPPITLPTVDISQLPKDPLDRIKAYLALDTGTDNDAITKAVESLKNAEPSAISSLLSQLITTGGRIIPDPRSNSLLIIDSTESIHDSYAVV